MVAGSLQWRDKKGILILNWTFRYLEIMGAANSTTPSIHWIPEAILIWTLFKLWRSPSKARLKRHLISAHIGKNPTTDASPTISPTKACQFTFFANIFQTQPLSQILSWASVALCLHTQISGCLAVKASLKCFNKDHLFLYICRSCDKEKLYQNLAMNVVCL